MARRSSLSCAVGAAPALACFAAFFIPTAIRAQALNAPWSGYARDPQHTALSAAPARELSAILWRTSVDLINAPNPNMPTGGGPLYIHYGSLSITAADTVLVPVRTTQGGYQVQAFRGATCASSGGGICAPLYTLPSDYSLPSHNWTPPYGPALSLDARLYYPGAGGTVLYRDWPDLPKGPNNVAGATGRLVFYGPAIYSANQSALNAAIRISTPITADHRGNIYFGFIAAPGNAAGVVSGLARIGAFGVGSWVSATALAGNDPNVTQISLNGAPALNGEESAVYVAVSGGGEFDTNGYLVSLNAATLAPIAHVQLFDPVSGLRATVSSDSSAAPMVGPDGDVYYGVLENPCCYSHNDRGWMLHFNSTLSTLKTPGSFGWDNTASVVPSASVPSYSGTSSYLILTKYNNYVGIGTGDGVNQVAVLDPNGAMQDPYSSATVMKEVIAVTGVTPDPSEGFPNAVKEWCINTTAIDPFTKSAIVNSEDGVVYRWDFTSNTLSQKVVLTSGIGEAYTPTAIGPDGAIYAINDAILFSVAGATEP
jgi:hypothetical protein